MSPSIDKLSIEKQDRDPEILPLIGSPCSFPAQREIMAPLTVLSISSPLTATCSFWGAENCPAGRLVRALLLPPSGLCVHLPAEGSLSQLKVTAAP